MKYYLTLLCSLSLCTSLIAQEDCTVATSFFEVNWNEITARFNHSRADFSDDASFNPAFEFPVGSGTHMYYASGFLFSGTTADGFLKVSHQLYGTDTDFAPGPISVGDVITSAQACDIFDRFWLITKAEVQTHLEYYDCLNDPGCDVAISFPDGYTIPDDFLSWPAHGDLVLAHDFYLAPFFDYDEDGLYVPENGDCPLYSDLVDGHCGEGLQGDVTLFWIENDRKVFYDPGSTGIEIHNMVYAYLEGGGMSPPYDRTLFHQRKLINRGIYTVINARIGAFVDPDLGNPSDDYVGCDVDENTGYVLNGDTFDEDGATPGYGATPPAGGYKLVIGPLMDLDDFDNDGNGIVDDETVDMGAFMVPGSSDLDSDIGIYNAMNALHPDGQPLLYGDTQIEALYAYPGYSDPTYSGTGGEAVDPWTEDTFGNPSGDRRFVISSEPFTFEPGATRTCTFAYICRGFDDDPWSTVGEMIEYSEDIGEDFEDCIPLSLGLSEKESVQSSGLSIFPNPTEDFITIQGATSGGEIEVFNLTGQSVMKETTRGRKHVLDLSFTPAGVYVVRFTGAGHVELATIVKH